MDVNEYLKKAEAIRKQEFMSVLELCRDMGIAASTWGRINAMPCVISLKTQKKLKKFVDTWYSKRDAIA